MESMVFGWIDYGIFGILLASTCLMGVYFSFVNRDGNATEYLFAGKKMHVLPIAISTLSSALGGVTYMGVPTETYLHGTSNAAMTLTSVVNLLFNIFVSLPIFWNLGLDDIYDYLELRFSKSARKLASYLYMFTLFLYTPIIVYAPALAFSQVTGAGIDSVIVIFSVICIFYTSFGGVKAVIWTEILQFAFALIGFFSVLVIGIIKIGGPAEVWRMSEEGGRINFFEMNPSLYERDTFWAMAIGALVPVMSKVAFGQKFHQRYRTMRSRADVNKSLVVKSLGWAVINAGCIFFGLVLYVHYRDCDPIKAGLVKRSDQLLPFYVMDVAGNIPGLPGLFLVGIVSSGLSVMSACLNTLTGMIYKDIVDPYILEGTKKSIGVANIMKILCLIIGTLEVLLTFVIQHFGTLYEMSRTISSAPEASLLCLFLLGLFCPWVGKTAAMLSAITSLVFIMSLIVGKGWFIYNDNAVLTHLPTSIRNCSWITTNLTMSPRMEEISDQDEPFFLFRISVLWYSTVGAIVGLVVGISSGLISRNNDDKTKKPEYYAPIVRRFLTKVGPKNDVPQMSLDKIRKIGSEDSPRES